VASGQECRGAMPIKLETLTWTELVALDRDRTVIIFPVSPLEEHGPHLPIGTDMYTAMAGAEGAAAVLERRRPDITVLIAPVLPIGSNTVPYFPGIGVHPRFVRHMAIRSGVAMAREGFRYIALVSGHLGPSHLAALEEAAEYVSRRYHITMIAPVAPTMHLTLHGRFLEQFAKELESPLTQEEIQAIISDDHAGALETSIMLHLHPGLVKGTYRELPPVTVRDLLRWKGWLRPRWSGYLGDPAHSRSDVGAAASKVLAEVSADLVLRAMDGEDIMAGLRTGSRWPLWLIWRSDFRRNMKMTAAGFAAALTGMAIWRASRRSHA
jgi:creatinine amidohydrolase